MADRQQQQAGQLSAAAAVAFEDFAGCTVPEAIRRCAAGEPTARQAVAVVWATDPDVDSLDEVMARPYPAVVDRAVGLFTPADDDAAVNNGDADTAGVDLDDPELQRQVGEVIRRAQAQQADQPADADAGGGS